jgi:hypothetical protein
MNTDAEEGEQDQVQEQERPRKKRASLVKSALRGLRYEMIGHLNVEVRAIRLPVA